MRNPTDLKRVQVVVLNDGRKFLRVNINPLPSANPGSSAIWSISELCLERGQAMMVRLLTKRLASPRPYKLGRPLDVLAMLVRSYQLGVGDLNPRSYYGAIDILSEDSDLTDTVMSDIVMHYVGRYSSLFDAFYGEELRKIGVEQEV